jgi:hypothetical protein
VVEVHGDEVSRGELVEIETDKANMAYEADQDGTLAIGAARRTPPSRPRRSRSARPPDRQGRCGGRRQGRRRAGGGARRAEGVDEHGRPTAIVDRLRDRLVQAAGRQREEPCAFIVDRQLFVAYREALDSLHARGARATPESLAAR